MCLASAPASAGTTACWFDNGAIIVPAAFGEMAGEFILDPSTAKSVMHVTAAEETGIEGASATATLRLAGRRRVAFAMEVADLSDREQGLVTSLVGILGADALAGEVVDIQTAPCRVRIGPGGPPLARAIRLPLRRIGGIPAVRAAISDGMASRTGWFAIDTGRLGARIADARLTRAAPADAGETPGRLRAISMAGVLYEQTPAGLMTPSAPGLAGSIGETVWSNYKIRLDLRHGVLELGATGGAR
ncbi:MAG TPA: hypothetical protein VG166_06775 [Caulobacteraceae bacterium]|nr:hypothetical protein [Caulobacteraceae bacterium]